MGDESGGAVHLSNELFEKLLKSLDHVEEQPVSPARLRLRRNVALLSAFVPSTLGFTVKGDRLVHADGEHVGDDYVSVLTRDGERWSIRDDVRAETLAGLHREGLLASFDGLTDDDDIACVMARHYIHGDAPPLSAQTIEQLQGTAFASDWLRLTPVAIPTPSAARARQAIEAVLEPMRQLVAQGFVGRASELEQLSDYAEVLPPSKRRKGVIRRIRRVFRMNEQPPLMIYGPGGVGKSTLVARFVLDHVDAGDDYRFPFAYLTFDRHDLRIDVPTTLLADAAAQLGAIFPAVRAEAAEVAQSARAAAAVELARTEDNRALQRSVAATSDASFQDEQIVLERFSKLVEEATGTHELPLLWVLDTFEAAQRRSPAGVDRLWSFLDRFQELCPRLRVVICGRADIDGHPTRRIELRELDRAEAQELLRIQLSDLDLPAEFLADVASSVASSPVSVRVAVLYIRAEAPRGLDTVERRRDVLLGLRSSQVHGILYRRFLDHIGNRDVRALANPGLVARRVTPPLIQHVLARLCGLTDVDEDRALELFEGLRREVSLVEIDGADGLRQRPELRRVMLPMAIEDEPELVAKVRRAALRYFSKQTSRSARIEELYYRLVLGQSSVTLDRVFDPRLAEALVESISELPPGSQVYLSTRLGLTVDPELLAHADDLAWARQAALTARRYLDAGDPQTALEWLASRAGDHVIPLTAPLLIEAHATMQQFGEALAIAQSSLAWAAARGDARSFVDIGLIAARVAEDSGRSEQAVTWLQAVDTTARSLDDLVAQCSAQVALLRMHRRGDSSDSPAARALRADLIQATKGLTARDRERNPWLVRDLAAEIGDSVPAITRAAVKLRGVDDQFVRPRRSRARRRDPRDALTQHERGQMQAEVWDESRNRVLSDALKAESDERAF